MTNQQSSKTYLVGDPGSCHCGNYNLAKELIRVGRECGLDAVKFQLFPGTPKYTKCGNVPLKLLDFISLVQYGKEIKMRVFASVFSERAYTVVREHCDAVKFSYKSPLMKMMAKALCDFKPNNVFVSGDILNQPPKHVRSLYCIPEYPVRYKIDFDGIFKRFDGFSDHTLGITQTVEAVRCGARIIEKHFRLDNPKCDSVPDGKFSISPYMLEKLCERVK